MRQRDVFHFGGFDSPNTTPTPDVLFDQLLSRLTGAELKVLLYIIRRTYGFHKNGDSISLTQITSGIITRDGKVLDRGTGLDRSSAIKATKTLGEKGIIQVRKERSDDGVNLVNIYGLRFRPIPISDQGVVEKTNYGGGEKPLPVVEKTPHKKQSYKKQSNKISNIRISRRRTRVSRASRMDRWPGFCSIRRRRIARARWEDW